MPSPNQLKLVILQLFSLDFHLQSINSGRNAQNIVLIKTSLDGFYTLDFIEPTPQIQSSGLQKRDSQTRDNHVGLKKFKSNQ
tara:strand:+ start:564 stop:809 length:246 start_codon:yes stop_codon:yes gene_type:complete